ncbi:hypothetical protein EBS43_08100 [bacterium]|jgi:hypothetical protein|nr:hypothetical protein [bacterium]
MKNFIRIIFILGIVLALQVLAADYDHPLYLSVRSLALGNAVISSVDDEQSLFLNPAGLAQVRSPKLSLLNLSLEGSHQLVFNSSDAVSVNKDFGIETLNQIIGKNEFAKVQLNTTLAVLGFGIGLIADGEAASRLLNRVSPTGELGAVGTYGVQVGYGLTVAQFRKGRGKVNFGIAGKYLYRVGKIDVPSLSSVLSLDKDTLLGDIKGVGYGLGLDSGLQVSYKLNNKFELLSGAVMSNIGSTTFSNGSPSLAPYLATGLGLRAKSRELTATLTYDLQRITESIDWRKKNHFGLELSLPIISFYGGLNGFWLPSYGVALNLALIRLMVASMAHELGTTIGQNTERRYAAQAQIKFEF